MGVKPNQPLQFNNHTPPPEADLSDPKDAEVWLDLFTAAITGYCGSAWTKEKIGIQMVSSQVASRAAIEVADAGFAAFKKRRK